MLNHNLSDPRKWPQLTLKQAPRHTQLSRLLPCGKLEQKRNGLACTVFLKRTRAQQSKLLQTASSAPKRAERAAAGRTHSRRGSFLRLASIRSH